MPYAKKIIPINGLFKLLLTRMIAVVLFFFICGVSHAQVIKYSVANAHSHNDYENRFPFTTAYNEQFGSIEADIFLWNDSLIVGHTENDIQYKRTLERLYLDPLQKRTLANNGFPYKDSSRSLQMLIDIKTTAIPTIKRLVEVLMRYPLLIKSTKITFVITGNRPDKAVYNSYPSFILFDGDLRQDYSKKELQKIPMFSDDLETYTKWNGTGNMSANDKAVIDSIIQKIHSLGKKIRFWDSPDIKNAWAQFIKMGVDYVNTDHIVELSSYLK